MYFGGLTSSLPRPATTSPTFLHSTPRPLNPDGMAVYTLFPAEVCLRGTETDRVRAHEKDEGYTHYGV